MDEKTRNFYALLDVAPGASDEEIRRAFRRAALRVHPDKFGNDPSASKKMRDLNRIRKILDEDRQLYDLYLEWRKRTGTDLIPKYFRVEIYRICTKEKLKKMGWT